MASAFDMSAASSADFHRELLCQLGAQPFDFSGIAEAVQHHIHALGAKGTGDAEADAAGRAGDEGNSAMQALVMGAAAPSKVTSGLMTSHPY